MINNLYYTYKELPASKLAEEKLNNLNEVYELALTAIKKELNQAEEQFVKERTEKREKAEWKYFMSEAVINSTGKHYHIHREAINPLKGDTDFYKDMSYCSFRIINNVFISTGGGYQFQNVKTGDILTDEEIQMLNRKDVPDKFKNKPIIKEGIYYTGS